MAGGRAPGAEATWPASRPHHEQRDPDALLNDDLVQRDCSTPARNRVWVTDSTEHPAGQALLLRDQDLFSIRILGYATDQRMTAQLAVTALRTAVARRQPTVSWWSTPTAAGHQ